VVKDVQCVFYNKLIQKKISWTFKYDGFYIYNISIVCFNPK